MDRLSTFRSVPKSLAVLIVGLTVWGLASVPRAIRPGGTAAGSSDLVMYESIADRVAAGENYYRVLASEMPSRGYATRPILNWRLPTLAYLNAALGSARARSFALVLCGINVALICIAALRKRHVPNSMIAVLVLMMVPTLFHPALPHLHEVWAGVLIVGSIALWSLGRHVNALVLAGMALAVRELTAVYVLCMAVLAWRDGRRREAAGWVVTSAVFAALYVVHASRVADAMPAEGLTKGWLGFGGWAFVLATCKAGFVPFLISPWGIAALTPAVWGGLWLWRDHLGRRLAVIVTAYFVLFMVVGNVDNWYWGFLISPLLPFGLVGWLDLYRTGDGGRS